MANNSWDQLCSQGAALASSLCFLFSACSGSSEVVWQPVQEAAPNSDSPRSEEGFSPLSPKWSGVVPPSAQRVVLSSDREWLAYALPLPRAKRSDPSHLRLVVRSVLVDPSSSNLRLGDEIEILATLDSRWPAPRWSHQGHRLAYISGTFDDYAGPGGRVYADVHVVRVPEKSEKVSSVVVGTRGSPSPLAWAPDDKAVGFAIDVFPQSKFIMCDLNSGTTTEISTDVPSSLEQLVSWSPDGKFVLIVTDSKAMVCDLDNRTVQVIVRLSAGASVGWTDPQWAPDRSHAVFVADDKVFTYGQGDREAKRWKRDGRVISACFVDNGRSAFIIEKLMDSPPVRVRLGGQCDIERWIYHGIICGADDLSSGGREVFRHSTSDSATMVVEGGAVARELPEVFDCLLNTVRN